MKMTTMCDVDIEASELGGNAGGNREAFAIIQQRWSEVGGRRTEVRRYRTKFGIRRDTGEVGSCMGARGA